MSRNRSQSAKRSYEPRHDKTNKIPVHPAKTQISLGIRPVWSKSSLSAWKKLGSLATHWAHSKDSDQTGRMPRLIWVFAGRTAILLVLSCRDSIIISAVLHKTDVGIMQNFIHTVVNVALVPSSSLQVNGQQTTIREFYSLELPEPKT